MNEMTLPNGKKIWMSVQSLRKFIIRTNHPEVNIIRDDNGTFVRLEFSDYYTMNKGDTIKLKDTERNINVSYILNDVDKGSNTSFYGIEQTVNKSCIFILPTLLNDYSFFDYNYSLYSVYISEDLNYIYLQYKFNSDNTYLKLERKLTEHADFMELLDPEYGFTVFKFKIKERFKEDIKEILNSRYSKISTKLKYVVLNFHKLGRDSKLGMILYKDKKYKQTLEKELGVYIPDDVELMSKTSKTEETWEYQSISQQIGTPNSLST